VRLHRSRGDLQAAARDAERFERAFRRAFAGRSAATGPGGPVAAVLDVIALDHLGRGEAARALEHYQRLFPDSATPGWGIYATAGLNGRMLQSVARKQLGDRPTAERELRAYLAEIAPLSVAEAGFEPFAVHAFLGETDAALAALKKASDAGFSQGWWGLRDGAFDPEYAAVLNDPRFRALFGELERRIAAARESYLADPDLPLETLLAAGLVPRESGSE
jgi:hypothetical protein